MKKILLPLLLIITHSSFSQQQPRLVKDITPGEVVMSSFPSQYVEAGGMIYFVAKDREHGNELWKTDGTEQGTMLVKDIFPGELSSNPRSLIEFRGELYFTAIDSATNQYQLMKSDGTAAGTGRYSTSVLLSFGEFVKIDTLLFFVSTFAFAEQEVFVTNGTDAGTRMLKDIHPTTTSSPRNLTVMNNSLFFSANDGVHGSELWKSDGTDSGTVMLKDLDTNGMDPGRPNQFEVVNGTLFFSAQVGNSINLWKSDGTDSGTVKIRNFGLIGNLNPNSIAAIDSNLFFVADDGSGRAVWISDGTETGTRKVKAGSNPWQIFNYGGLAFFEANDTLWLSDGTDTGTVSLKNNLNIPNTERVIVEFNNALYFIADNFRLWTSDGTDTGTVMLKDIEAYDLSNINGSLYFTASDSLSGTEIWSSDGTGQGTSRLKDIFPNTRQDTRFGESISIRDQVFMIINSDKLWVSDGTSDGTIFLEANDARSLVNYRDTLYLGAKDSKAPFNAGAELWKSDGTLEGTELVVDILTNASGNPRNLTNVNGKLFFSASVSATNFGAELWVTDGTPTGTVLVKDINNSGDQSSFPTSFRTVNNKLLFFADDGVRGRELWKSDGTTPGTVLVKDIHPIFGGVSSFNESVTVGDSLLFFAADDGTHGYELWKSDGRGIGTQMVKDIMPGSNSSNINHMVAMGGEVFFSANDGSNGFELWKSDGTANGTVMVENINATGASLPSFMVATDSVIYFMADDGINGKELWRSDGTAGGTFLVRDVRPGAEGSEPGLFRSAAGKLYFSADDGIHGRELWETKGTFASTRLVQDLEAGGIGSNPRLLDSPEDALFFSASTSAYGSELWRIGPCLATFSSDTIIACDSYTWTNGITYATDTLVTDTLINAAGCDSIRTLNLRINKSNSATDVQTSCGPFTWIDGITYTSNNNTARDTLSNVVGCDSIISLDLTIISIDTSVSTNQDTLMANQEGAKYRWLDCNNDFARIPGLEAGNQLFVPIEGGSYAVKIKLNGCEDTSFCYVSAVGLASNALAQGISIYPNPVKDQLNIIDKEALIERIEIIDLHGTLIKRVEQRDKEIDLTKLSKGVYFLRIVGKDERLAYKCFVKF